MKLTSKEQALINKLRKEEKDEKKLNIILLKVF